MDSSQRIRAHCLGDASLSGQGATYTAAYQGNLRIAL